MGWLRSKMGRLWLSVSVNLGLGSFGQIFGGILERFFWILMNLSSNREASVVLENLSLTVISLFCNLAGKIGAP